MAAKAKKPRGARKSTIKRKKASNAKRERVLLWAKRIGISFVSVILFGWGVLWFVMSDSHTSSMHWAQESILQASARAGFRVDNILVEGRENTNSALLIGLLNVQKGDPIFILNPREAKEQIEQISWVESARVERRLPNTIYVLLKERKPFALWHHEGKLSVIDINGMVLSDQNLEPFQDFVMIRGIGAPEKAGDFLQTLAGEPALMEQMDHAILIDNRRWDILLKDGKRIKLPEEDIGLALRTLMAKDAEENILGKDIITDIDARHQGRLIIRTKPGAVQNLESSTSESGVRL